MLFNTFIFFVFLAAVVSVYHFLKSVRAQNSWLLLCSYVFYGFWDWRFLGLILLSTIIDYFVSHGIHKAEAPEARKRLVTLSVITNLSLLGVFKYYGFFATELNDLLQLIGLAPSVPILNIVLPVGISFYTFQTLSYTIDIYRRQNHPCDNFFDFALYVSFFPQLVAGPIERSTNLLPQIVGKRTSGKGDFSEGLYYIACGLFKKVVIADNMAVLVDHVFSQPVSELTAVEVIIGVYAFAFQIYGDFSGYSLIAKGVARWLGFELMWNFNHPYFSLTPSEFWNRWHISLSSWLRDYLYIPLGGNRGGTFFTYRNLMATMVIGGLWHGAGWPFVLWGFYQGLLLVVFRVGEGVSAIRTTCTRLIDAHPAFRWLAIFLFFQFVCYGWMLFRAESFTQIQEMTALLFSSNYQVTDLAVFGLQQILLLTAPLLLFEAWVERKQDRLALLQASAPWLAAFYGYVLVSLLLWVPQEKQVFIYFQF
jgi:D-alanyl-lipoteichoic acid acyltransferase DltB (MBOAT superfamily)